MAAQAMSFFTAGNETSSSIIAYTIYELALHMDIQNRLKNEIRTSIDSHKNEFTYESIQEMKYLDMVLSGKYLYNSFIKFLNIKLWRRGLKNVSVDINTGPASR